ncbi:MAG: hypothetical protein R3313_05335, partial [Candidatus Saccharimonadales bacterium]|nr:hypothetical protein [Candidatus Saccharimonadales bacterium]
ETLPQFELAEAEEAFADDLAARIDGAQEAADGEWFHHQIYEAKEAHQLEPKQAFETIYQLILGQSSGPRAGWFLSTLERDWLTRRLRRQS